MKIYKLVIFLHLIISSSFFYGNNKDGVFDFVLSRDFKEVANFLKNNTKLIIDRPENDPNLKEIYPDYTKYPIDTGNLLVTSDPYFSIFFCM